MVIYISGDKEYMTIEGEGGCTGEGIGYLWCWGCGMNYGEMSVSKVDRVYQGMPIWGTHTP